MEWAGIKTRGFSSRNVKIREEHSADVLALWDER